MYRDSIKKMFLLPSGNIDMPAYLAFRKERAIQSRLKYQEKHKTNLHAKHLRYMRSSKERDIEFSLSVDQFNHLISQCCYYCGTSNSIGIDRIDSKLGYIIDNARSCCTMCNRMKFTYTTDQFLEQVRRIHELHNW